jgi:type I restriction enzyme S subunit
VADDYLRVGELVTLQRGTTYDGALVGDDGPALLGLGSVEPGGGFRTTHFKTFGGKCPPKLMVAAGQYFVALKGATKDGSMVGSIAKVPAWLRSGGRLTQDTARLDFSERGRGLEGYLYWMLRTPQYRAYCAGRLTGSASASFSREDFLAYRFPAPDSRRSHIVEALGALEDKIELNRRTSETLEATARAIFKSWLIDGDGSQSSETWPFVPVTQLISINPPRRVDRCRPAPYLDMANMPTRGPSAAAVSFRPLGSGARFMNGDTLMARITPCLENGKTALVDFLDGDQCGWGSTEFIVLRPRPPLPDEFAYCLARLPEFVAYAVARMSGSSGRQRVSASSIGEYVVRMPPPALAERFGRAVQPMFRRITALGVESRTLADIRDALLPRLISGDLHVADLPHAIRGTAGDPVAQFGGTRNL